MARLQSRRFTQTNFGGIRLKIVRYSSSIIIASLILVAASFAGQRPAARRANLALVHAGMRVGFEKSGLQPLPGSEQENDLFSHEAAGVQFQLPKGWKAEPDGEQILVTAPDHSFSVVFWVPDEDSFE